MELNKYIDHTALKSAVSETEIETLCAEAKQYNFASVCVNPFDVALAVNCLSGSSVKVCTVIGFPLGKNATEVKVFETEKALKDGKADAIVLFPSTSLRVIRTICLNSSSAI